MGGRREKRVKHTIHVHNGKISSANNHALAHDQSEATSASSDDTNLALKREGGKRGQNVHASASGTRNGLRGWQLVLLGVLDGDTIISTRKGAGMGRLVLVLVGGLGAAGRGVNTSSQAKAAGGATMVGLLNHGSSAKGACKDASLATTSHAKGSGGSATERHLGWIDGY